MQIKADEKELQGQYSNLVMIHHNLEEFTLNFIYIFPNGTQGKLTGSMIVSPGHAKRIWRALGENIARYESQFGAIKESPAGSEPDAHGGLRAVDALRLGNECLRQLRADRVNTSETRALRNCGFGAGIVNCSSCLQLPLRFATGL